MARAAHDYVAVVAACFAAVAAAVSGLASYWQWLDSRVENRAWLAVDLAVADRIQVTAGGMVMDVDYAVSNSGNLPASDVVPVLALASVQPGAPLVSPDQMPAVCQGVGDPSTSGGDIVFPHSAEPTHDAVTRLSGDVPANATAGHPVSMVVAGCITYRDGIDDMPRYTGVEYRLLHQNQDASWSGDFAVGQSYTVDQLKLQKLPAGAFAK
jgi:hypothetical protein